MEELPNNRFIRKTIEALLLHKAEDIVLIDLHKFKTLLDDNLLICTCQSEVQMRAVLRKCERVLKTEGLTQVKIEYSPGVKWGILKSDEFILHVFEGETRAHYSLERLWADATIIELKPDNSTIQPVSETKESISESKEDNQHEFL